MKILILSYRKKHIKPKIKGLRKKRRFFQTPLFWFFLLFFIIVFALIYGVLFAPWLQVQRTTISGNEKVKSGDIENIVWFNMNRKVMAIGGFQITTKNIFLIDAKKMVNDIKNKFLDIESIEIKKNLPNEIIISIKERNPYATFCEQSGTCFLMDEQGVVFELLKDIPKNKIILRQDQSSHEIYLGQNVIEKEKVLMIDKIQKNLKDNFQIESREVLVSNPIVLTTSENWQVYFDADSNIDLQITKLNILLKDKISPSARKNLQYIYLQYKDKAYYK